MPEAILPYKDWKDFFSKRLAGTGAFRLSNTFTKGNTETEVYSAILHNPETSIEAGYLPSNLLIYVHILNPSTPGKNLQQEMEHLYKYEFDEEKQYGPPGLDFNELNLQGIGRLLEQGFNGSETVYYRNGKPVKSVLTSGYYPDSPQSTFTYRFQRELFFRKLLNSILRRKDKYDDIRTINLQDVYGGVKEWERG